MSASVKDLDKLARAKRVEGYKPGSSRETLMNLLTKALRKTRDQVAEMATKAAANQKTQKAQAKAQRKAEPEYQIAKAQRKAQRAAESERQRIEWEEVEEDIAVLQKKFGDDWLYLKEDIRENELAKIRAERLKKQPKPKPAPANTPKPKPVPAEKPKKTPKPKPAPVVESPVTPPETKPKAPKNTVQRKRPDAKRSVFKLKSKPCTTNGPSVRKYYYRLASSDRTSQKMKKNKKTGAMEYSRLTISHEAAEQLDNWITIILQQALNLAKGIARNKKRTRISDNDFLGALRQLLLTRGVSLPATSALIAGVQKKFVGMGFEGYIAEKRGKGKAK